MESFFQSCAVAINECEMALAARVFSANKSCPHYIRTLLACCHTIYLPLLYSYSREGIRSKAFNSIQRNSSPKVGFLLVCVYVICMIYRYCCYWETSSVSMLLEFGYIFFFRKHVQICVNVLPLSVPSYGI